MVMGTHTHTHTHEAPVPHTAMHTAFGAMAGPRIKDSVARELERMEDKCTHRYRHCKHSHIRHTYMRSYRHWMFSHIHAYIRAHVYTHTHIMYIQEEGGKGGGGERKDNLFQSES